MKNIAIILGGGEGRRFSNKTPKQFLLISGKPLIYYTIKNFQSIEEIDEIVIVSHKDFVEKIKNIVSQYGMNKVRNVIEGGMSRCESTYKALTLLSDTKNAKVLLHDAARPCISAYVIKECITSLDVYVACAVATPSTDTVFEVNNEKILNIPERQRMYLAQTPQGFHLELIKTAYDKWKQDKANLSFSDDAGVFMHYFANIGVHIVDGNKENIKLTYPEDETYIKKLIKTNFKI